VYCASCFMLMLYLKCCPTRRTLPYTHNQWSTFMKCPQCGTPMTAERDPYGTGDSWYVVYEQQCTCTDETAEGPSKLMQTVLENHEEYMKKLEEK